MRFTILPLALLLATLGASQAQANTTISCNPCSYPYQHWVDKSKAPTPEVGLTLIEDMSMCSGVNACTSPGFYKIWDQPIQQTKREAREVFLHEVGHNFDYYVMPEWARQRFENLIGDHREWTEDPNAPNEKFAEAWRWCAEIGPHMYRAPLSYGYNYRPTPTLEAKVCRMIAFVGS